VRHASIVVFCVIAWLAPGPAAREAYAASAEHSARKPPPTKGKEKRKSSAPRKRPRRKVSTLMAQQEQDLHAERLAVMGRFKEVNASLRDAELAAIIRRLDELETKRHGLAEELIKRTEEQERGEDNP
jgi:hypothetical protein